MDREENKLVQDIWTKCGGGDLKISGDLAQEWHSNGLTNGLREDKLSI